MATESPAARAARLAERKRVDDELEGRKAQQRARREPAKGKQYPAAINMMGQGFRNLYDVLGGRDWGK